MSILLLSRMSQQGGECRPQIRRHVLCSLILIYTGLEVSVETIPDTEKRCFTRIYLSEVHAFNGKILIEGNPDCDSLHVSVLSDDVIYDRILYFFSDLDPDVCSGILHRLTEVEGNQTLCHDNQVFETEGNELNLKFAMQDLLEMQSVNNHSHLDLYFTAFHTGRCESWDFQCGSGQCIYHTLSCSGDNPCGDKSDCHISIPAMISLGLGGVCVIGVLAVIVFIACKICPCCSCGRGGEWAPRKFSPTKALENVQSFTPATVTFVPLKRTWSYQ